MGRLFDGLAGLGVPRTHFGVGTAGLLRQQAAAGGEVIGLDWRIALADGWALVGDRAVQGNLDPALLLGPFEAVADAARWILAQSAGRPGHIFNLGHGVIPETDPDDLRRLVDLVHESDPRKEPAVSADAVLLMAYGSPRPARPGRGLLHRHPARATRRRPSCSRSCSRATGRSAAARRCRGSWSVQRGALERELAARGRPVRVYAGMRHIEPRIGTIVEQMAGDGFERFVAIALAPQASSNAAGYRRAVEAALAGLGDARAGGRLRRVVARPAALHRGARRRRPARRSTGSPIRQRPRVMFTAHSLPARVVAEGDAVPDRARRDGGARRRTPRPRPATSSPTRAPAAPASRGSARTSSTRSGGWPGPA